MILGLFLLLCSSIRNFINHCCESQISAICQSLSSKIPSLSPFKILGTKITGIRNAPAIMMNPSSTTKTLYFPLKHTSIFDDKKTTAIRAKTPNQIEYSQSIYPITENYITVANDLNIIKYIAVADVTSGDNPILSNNGL